MADTEKTIRAGLGIIDLQVIGGEICLWCDECPEDPYADCSQLWLNRSQALQLKMALDELYKEIDT